MTNKGENKSVIREVLNEIIDVVEYRLRQSTKEQSAKFTDESTAEPKASAIIYGKEQSPPSLTSKRKKRFKVPETDENSNREKLALLAKNGFARLEQGTILMEKIGFKTPRAIKSVLKAQNVVSTWLKKVDNLAEELIKSKRPTKSREPRGPRVINQSLVPKPPRTCPRPQEPLPKSPQIIIRPAKIKTRVAELAHLFDTQADEVMNSSRQIEERQRKRQNPTSSLPPQRPRPKTYKKADKPPPPPPFLDPELDWPTQPEQFKEMCTLRPKPEKQPGSLQDE